MWKLESLRFVGQAGRLETQVKSDVIALSPNSIGQAR